MAQWLLNVELWLSPHSFRQTELCSSYSKISTWGCCQNGCRVARLFYKDFGNTLKTITNMHLTTEDFHMHFSLTIKLQSQCPLPLTPILRVHPVLIELGLQWCILHLISHTLTLLDSVGTKGGAHWMSASLRWVSRLSQWSWLTTR